MRGPREHAGQRPRQPGNDESVRGQRGRAVGRAAASGAGGRCGRRRRAVAGTLGCTGRRGRSAIPPRRPSGRPFGQRPLGPAASMGRLSPARRRVPHPCPRSRQRQGLIRMPLSLGYEDLPMQVQCLENVWIPLSDGIRLSATVWLPEMAADSPVPAILEYLPYRKSDATAIDDSVRHPYFAGHGYASVRVDIRGTGDSEGILLDEYHPQEQDDALEVLRWLGAQPWCSGAVGMMGISWGGFNSLQVAARRPPELKAIISACSTDDRYADDVHYIGGTVLSYYMLLWAAVMLAYSARPPDPLVVGDCWRDMWRQRLEHNAFLI